MMFPMTINTENFKVFKNIVFSIFVLMMNFKFNIIFMTAIAFVNKIFKRELSIEGNSISIFRIFLSDRSFFRKMTELSSFNVFAFFRAVFSINSIARSYKITLLTFFTDFFNTISSVVFMKTCLAAKKITGINRSNFKNITAFFTAFRFPDFGSRKRIASLTTVKLSLIIPRNLLTTLFTIHKNNVIRNTLTSQSYRRNYG